MILRQSDPKGDVIVDVVTKIANREDVSPTDLPPLSRSIDPDALDSLVDSPGSDTVSISFTYCGYDVTIDSSGVTVHEQ